MHIDHIEIQATNKENFTSKIIQKFEKIGYLRAARELERIGYHEQAAICAQEAQKYQ